MRYLLPFLALASAPASAGLITVDAADYALGTDISTISSGATLSQYTNRSGPGVSFDPVTVSSNPWGTDIAPHRFDNANGFSFGNIRSAQNCLLTGEECNLTRDTRFGVLHVAFDAPTDYVAIDVHTDEFALDGSILRAYDAAGSVLVSCRIRGTSNGDPTVQGYLPGSAPTCGDQYRRYEVDGNGEMEDCNNTAPGFDHCATDTIAFISVPSAIISYIMWGSEGYDDSRTMISSVTYNQVDVPEPGSFGLIAIAGLLAAAFRRKRLEAGPDLPRG